MLHSPDVHNSQSRTSPKRVRSFFQVSDVGAEAPGPRPSSTAFLDYKQEVELEMEPQVLT